MSCGWGYSTVPLMRPGLEPTAPSIFTRDTPRLLGLSPQLPPEEVPAPCGQTLAPMAAQAALTSCCYFYFFKSLVPLNIYKI